MYTLENSSIQVKINENGGICGLFDKRNSREYISERVFTKVCRIMLPNFQWDGRFADIGKQKSSSVTVKETEIVFAFPSIVTENGDDVKIAVDIHYQLSGDEIFAYYEIENNSKEETVSHIMFPVVEGIGKRFKDCRLVMPEQSAFADSRVEDPFSYGDGNHKEWTRSNNRKSVRYPQLLTTAWMDYSDGIGGVGFEQRSENFDICDMGFERVIVKSKKCRDDNLDHICFSLQGYPNISYGEKRKSPVYIISVHDGDWRTMAMRHRVWLKGIIDFPLIPGKFKKALGWHFYFMKQQDGTIYRRYCDLPEMAEASKKAGLDFMMVFGWYPHGHDNEYPFGYYANDEWGGKDYLKEQLEKCRDIGCEVIPFFNGTLLDISTEGYKKEGYRWPVLGRTGKPYCGTEFSRANHDMGFANASLSTSTRNMTLLDICITAQEVREWWKKTVLRITTEYGFHNLQLDQIAHKSYVCYDESHHHERPEYAYTKELRSLLSEVRDIVRAQNGIMVGEGMTDLTMMFCDGFWNWHQAYNMPEIVRYSVPWMNYSHEVDANEFDTVNLCFAERILLDLKVDGGDGIVTDYPVFCEHLKKLSDLKKRLGTAYIDGEYYLQDDLLSFTLEGKAVVRVYKMERDIAVVMANLSNTVSRVTYNMAYDIKDARVQDFSGVKFCNDSKHFAFSIPEYEVLVLEGTRAENS